jgi:serine/threonine protein kinase
VTPLHAGDRIDHFLLEELVSRGGMASVFRATDTRSGTQVAIKVPHPEAECDPVLFDRFEREAEIGRKLDHPGIVKVLPEKNLPEEKRSRVYMALEWVEGRLLRTVLDEEGKLPPARAIAIATAVCDALQYMHGQGVLHRDLKPENIMLCADGGIRIIDFGIAALAGSRRLTFGNFSRRMGTPDYAAPEQVKGKRGDARTDVYQLGIVIYEMLTGRTPFTGVNDLLVLNSRLVNNPVAPSEANPELCAGLEAVLLCALERDPERRYPSARHFAAALSISDSIHSDVPQRTISVAAPALERNALLYSGLAMIPAGIFGLLIYVATHQ